jgi:release factor glutamine methyltransferase
MIISELIHSIAERLKKIHDNPVECQQDAWWMLQAITKKSEAELLAQKDIVLLPEQQKLLDDWLNKHIAQHEPLQYLLGTVPFCGLDILVEPPVLIPRPETEEWCCRLIEQLKTMPNKNLTILDIGSGSGCLAIALAKNFPQAQVYAVDISDKALALSKKNARAQHVTNITFLKSNVFDQLKPPLKFDLIVSNPPYIPAKQWTTLDPSVTQWEDQKALIAGPQGLDIIDIIIQHASGWLKPNKEMQERNIPQLMIEINYDQGQKVQALLTKAGFRDSRIQKDLEGKDRVACASI